MAEETNGRDDRLDLSGLGSDAGNDEPREALSLSDDDEPIDPERLPGLKNALKEERKRTRAFKSELSKLGYTVNKDGTLVPPVNGGGKDDEDTRRTIREEADREWSQRLVQVEARAELTAAGFKGDPKRGARMLELDGVTPGDTEALKEAIEDLKADSPSLFRKSRTRDGSDEDDEQDGHARRLIPSADQGKRLSQVTQNNPADLFGSFRKSNGWD
jgi:hypothetical protein